MIFPLQINQTTRLFGGHETVYIGKRKLKLFIPEKLDYGDIISVSNVGAYLHPNFPQQDIKFKLAQQEGNSKRQNIYLALPRETSKQGAKGSQKRISVEVKGSEFSTKKPVDLSNGKIFRMNGIGKKVFGVPGDLFITTFEFNVSEKKSSKTNLNNTQPHNPKSYSTHDSTETNKSNTKSSSDPSQWSFPSDAPKQERQEKSKHQHTPSNSLPTIQEKGISSRSKSKPSIRHFLEPDQMEIDFSVSLGFIAIKIKGIYNFARKRLE